MNGDDDTPASPNEIDVAVGLRIQACRRRRGMSRESLAAALGVTVGQIEKYEAGRNRVTARRLFEISLILQVLVADLYPNGFLDENPTGRN